MGPAAVQRPAKAALVPAGLVTVLLAFLGACSGPASSLPLAQIQDIALPGAASRLDYQALDADAKRLYIAHLGDGTVHAVDLASGAVAGTVQGTPSVHGVTLAADRHLLLAAVSGTNEVAIIDTNTLTVTTRIQAGDTPDGIAYDPVSRTVLVNVQDRNELVTIDPATDAVTGRIPIPDCASNHGLYVDGANKLAFITCEGSAKLLLLDLQTKQVSARFDTGSGPDVLAFDQGFRRLYVASESGVVSVFDEQNRNLTLKASGKLADYAHTVAVDQATHRVYFPLQDIDGHPVLRIMDARQ